MRLTVRVSLLLLFGVASLIVLFILKCCSNFNFEHNIGSAWTKVDNGQESSSGLAECLRLGRHRDTAHHQVLQQFTIRRIYPPELGLGHRVVEKPYTLDDVAEGIYRTDPTTGSHYELHLRRGEVDTKVVLFRAFAPLRVVLQTKIQHHNILVHIIVPLSGRIATFQRFLDNFSSAVLDHDRRVYLTVVYFQKEGLEEAQQNLNELQTKHNFSSWRLINLDETFSRGEGLRVGAESWSQSEDVLMFFCDVDVTFNAKFLDRCRLNAVPGLRVYYPIVFSLYNPAFVYSLQDHQVPPYAKQMTVSKETGFWRNFGYGMTCQYLSDFQAVKGFEETTVGWGGEDVLLYRKYVRSQLAVILATDPDIFHMWHEKKCDSQLSSSQYMDCIRTRVIIEASHEQLGLFAKHLPRRFLCNVLCIFSLDAGSCKIKQRLAETKLKLSFQQN